MRAVFSPRLSFPGKKIRSFCSSTSYCTRSKKVDTMYGKITVLTPLLASLSLLRIISSFSGHHRSYKFFDSCQCSTNVRDDRTIYSCNRRSFVQNTASLFGIVSFQPAAHATNEEDSLASLILLVEEAKTQLAPIPDLIKEEKWDSIRTILSTPPLSRCWSKSGQVKPLLLRYAEAIGNELPNGDELAALEGKEDAISHLRYLDMAVYNNVFNPIKTEGETGATKELIKSYYEDPKVEYAASLNALSELISLGK